MNRIKNMKGFEYGEAEKRNPAIMKRGIFLSLVKKGSSVYLVNESSETLESVRTENWGFSGELTLKDDRSFSYQNIKPNEGVAIYEPQLEESEVDYIMMSDFKRGEYIYVESPSLGKIRITPKNIKHRGLIDQPLVYLNLESPKSVMLTHIKD